MAKIRLLIAGASLAAAMGVLSSPAWATVTIGFEDPAVSGGAKTTEASGATTASFSGTYGAFDVNNISGTVPGILGDLLNSNALDLSTTSAGGTLDVFVTYSGITSPAGLVDFTSDLTSNNLVGPWTVTEKTFIDPANGIFTTTIPLASQLFTDIGTNVQTDAASTGAGPYSLTEEYIISAPGIGGANDTIDVSAAAPEPAAWAMMLLAVFGFGAVLRRTRDQRAVLAV